MRFRDFTENDAPKSIPSEGSVEYMGFRLERYEGISVGHSTTGGGLLKQLGIGTKKKISGVLSTNLEDSYERYHPTLRKAIEFIHTYNGIES